MMDFMSGKIELRDAEFGDLTAGERSPALGSEHLLSSLLVLGSVLMWSRDVRGRNESAAIPHSAAEVSDTAGGRGWESSPGAFPILQCGRMAEENFKSVFRPSQTSG